MEDAASTPTERIGQHYNDHTTVVETLLDLCESLQVILPQAVHVGLSTTIDATPGTYVFTDLEVVEIDRAQYKTGEGPCIDSLRTGQVVRIDATSRGPYPAFREVAARHGIGSTVSLPMIAEDAIAGTMNVYARPEHAFTDDDVAEGERFAAQAAYVAANAKAYWDARKLSEGLAVALRSRAVIEQAKGIIMATTGASAEEAFLQLSEQSQHENVKLREIATEIVRRSVHR
jgi:GAF domain-containing protein